MLNILPVESLDTEALEVTFTVPATYAFKPNIHRHCPELFLDPDAPGQDVDPHGNKMNSAQENIAAANNRFNPARKAEFRLITVAVMRRKWEAQRSAEGPTPSSPGNYRR